jgi:hypothetical protein
MQIEPERTEAISKVPPPHNKKSMQSFLGRINFIRWFIPSFTETVKPLQDIIKKNVEFKWGSKEKEAFDIIKGDILQAPALLSPYFDRDFILYTFSSNIAFVVVLTQKNLEGDKFLVAFMSSGLQGVELNYPEVDKHAYVVFKVVKHFRPFLLKSKTKVIVLYPACQKSPSTKRLSRKKSQLDYSPTRI